MKLRITLFLALFLGLSFAATASLAQEKVIVRSGDWLSTIAWQHLGNKMDWFKLWAWNAKTVGQNPNLIFPDSTLALPPDSSAWHVQRADSIWQDGGWVIEFVFRDSTDRFVVSVGFDSTEGIKFALNAVNFHLQKCCSRARDFEWIDWDSPSGLMLDRDNPGYVHRYTDQNRSHGSNFLVRSVPDGLPLYIPHFYNRVSN